jgi:hypothetical protein
MTIGHVYYQEPVQVMSQIYYSFVVMSRLLYDEMGGREGVVSVQVHKTSIFHIF